jgi:hypothetical protein
MARVVDIAEWRRTHRHPAGSREQGAPVTWGAYAEGLDQLDRAVARLGPLVNRRLEAGRIERRVETELLAIIGELTVGLVGEAARRAERLATQLEEAK